MLNIRSFTFSLLSPRQFYYATQSLEIYLRNISFIFLFLGLGWGLFFAPPDYLQGDGFRIIYVHVPAAFLSMALYAVMGGLAIIFLVWRIKIAAIFMYVLPSLGGSMALLALITGSIWGKPMWGTWWIWDARLTSEFVLFLLYMGIFALQSSFKSNARSDQAMAILVIIGLIDLPIIHYSVYWWSTLHQAATISIFAKPKIAWPMLYPLLVCLFGFSCYCAWITLAKARGQILLREKRQHWVKKEVILVC